MGFLNDRSLAGSEIGIPKNQGREITITYVIAFIVVIPLLSSRLTTTTTKLLVSSIWGRLYEPKENYDGTGTWISFFHSFLSNNMPSLRPLASISYRITSIHVFFDLLCALSSNMPSHTCRYHTRDFRP